MRIGVDIIGLASGQVSGIEQYTLQILKELIRQNPNDQFILFAIDYYFRSFGGRLEKVLAGPGRFLLEAPNVILKKLPWPKIPLSLHFAWKVLGAPKVDKFLGGVDVFFQPAPLLLPLSSKIPRVVTFHDLVPAIYPQYFTTTSRLWHWQMNYPVRAKEADRIIAVSENTKNDLIRLYGIPPSKITVIYEGASQAFQKEFSPEALTEVRNRLFLPDEFIFYVGSLEPRKNVLSLISALKYLKERGFAKIKLVLAGSKKWKEGKVLSEIKRLHLEKEVVFLGWVEEEDKVALFKLALAFVFPSLYEGFGLPVLEALTAGCPVITSQNSSLPEVTSDAALLIDPLRQDSLNQALLELISQPDLRENLKLKGQKHASLFSWEKAAGQTMEIIRAERSG